MFTFNPTAAALATITGFVLSLLFSYVPGLNAWFAAKPADIKRLFMAGLTLLVALVIFGLGCAGIVRGLTCDQAGVIQMIFIYILALAANQTAYQVSPLPASVHRVKALQAGESSSTLGRG